MTDPVRHTRPGGLPFTKGHGTENDFVLIADPDGKLDLDPGLIARLCDRRAGIGADGVIRVVRAGALSSPPQGDLLDAEWFMDYRNADGSVAEMCGNGVRVFVAFLLRENLVDAGALNPDGPGLPVATRGGVKRVHQRDDGWLSVEMGQWRVSEGLAAAQRGHDCLVHLPGFGVALPGLSLDLGNPHTVVMLPAAGDLDAVDLTRPPTLEPAAPHGSNVEVLTALAADESTGHPVGRLRMRVHERGVGETRSCGTGACAAAAAAALWSGASAPAVWVLDVPGGRVEVALGPGTEVTLSGPAVLVADGVFYDPGLAT